MRFVIIGGDAAGMSAASRAKRNNPGLEVVVLEQSTDVSYSACNMPYNIADPARTMEDLVVRSEAEFIRRGIDLRTGHRAECIDREQRSVSGSRSDGSSFELPYDRLLIATGASAIRPDLPGIDAPGVFVLKTLAEGRAIKQWLATSKVRRAVILGMGYIALEMCEALHALGISVDLIKPRTGLLPWLDPELSAHVRNHLELHGVGLHDGHRVERIVEHGDGLRIEAGDLQLDAQLVLAAVGVRPNAGLAADAGLELSAGGSIATDRSLRTSDPLIYAAGDCADSYHIITGQKTWVPLALRANRAGWAVADHVCGQEVALPGIVGTAVFKVFEMEVARCGLSPLEAEQAGFDPISVQIRSRSRAGIYPGSQPLYVAMCADRATARLLGAQLAGTDQAALRINAAAVALHAGLRVEEFKECDLAYAPPFGPTWDPLLVAANQLIKQLP